MPMVYLSSKVKNSRPLVQSDLIYAALEIQKVVLSAYTHLAVVASALLSELLSD